MALHQGGRLKYLVDHQNTPNAEIARAAGISTSTLYNYYMMEEINSKKLKNLCNVLGVDYVKNFVLETPEQVETVERQSELKLENDHLKRENSLLREQIEQLKEIIALKKGKK